MCPSLMLRATLHLHIRIHMHLQDFTPNSSDANQSPAGRSEIHSYLGTDCFKQSSPPQAWILIPALQNRLL
jgi:hypothetical protein